MGIYFLLAVAGLILTWYHNLQFMMNSDEALTPTRFIQGGLVNPIASSITYDLIIGASAFTIWMMVEGSRLKMKNIWFYFITTFLVAFAFAGPFFLFMRERKLMTMEKLQG